MNYLIINDAMFNPYKIEWITYDEKEGKVEIKVDNYPSFVLNISRNALHSAMVMAGLAIPSQFKNLK